MELCRCCEPTAWPLQELWIGGSSRSWSLLLSGSPIFCEFFRFAILKKPGPNILIAWSVLRRMANGLRSARMRHSSNLWSWIWRVVHKIRESRSRSQYPCSKSLIRHPQSSNRNWRSIHDLQGTILIVGNSPRFSIYTDNNNILPDKVNHKNLDTIESLHGNHRILRPLTRPPCAILPLALPTFIVKLAERDGPYQYETWMGSPTQLGSFSTTFGVLPPRNLSVWRRRSPHWH